jgi:hypothetical protein
MKSYSRPGLFSSVMKNISKKNFLVNAFETCSPIVISAGLFLTLALNIPNAAIADSTTQMGKAFATPEDAVLALTAAVNSQAGNELGDLFGPAYEDLKNPDRVQATNELEAFAAALNATNRVVYESATHYELDVGPDAFPFPIPIVKSAEGYWFFDAEAGKEEILNRRIGRNELDVLQAMRAYVDAQRDYASKDHAGDGVLEYAQRIASSLGKKDGLYWSPDLDGELSPLGPLVADAQTEGYDVQARGQQATRAPFHGYYFKILTRQGSNDPGGRYDYIINGHMIGGFALIAWPAEYGNSGIMTFIVNQRGKVYQRDLGPNTSASAPAMTEYDPGRGWSLSHE